MEKSYLTKNGVCVYDYQNNKIGSFAISLFLRSGLIYENEDDNGFAHFFEHCVFRNINAVMDGKMYETLDKCGLDFNAVTHVNYIEITIGGATAHFDDAARIIALALSPIVFNKTVLDAEKRRIKAEIRENGNSSIERFSDKTVFKGSSVENKTILGKVKNINSFSLKMMKEKTENVLTRENMFFYVGGNFSESSLLNFYSLIENQKVFSGTKRDNKVTFPESFGKRNCAVVVKNAPATEVYISFDVKISDCTLQELLCLWDTLFLGESCPMYRELSENLGLIYSYSDTMSLFDDFAGMGVLYEVRSDKLMQSLETVFEMFEKAKSCSDKRLPFILPFFTDDGDIILDDAGKIVSDFGYYSHILDCGYKSTDDMKNAFRSVRGERLNELAGKIFRPDNLVVALKGSKKKIDTEAIRRAVFEKLGGK